MFKTTLTIDGMMCAMCEAHICEVIRKTVPEAKKVVASRAKGEASFLSAAPADENRLREAVAATGYTCKAVTTVPQEKRGLFGLR